MLPVLVFAGYGAVALSGAVGVSNGVKGVKKLKKAKKTAKKAIEKHEEAIRSTEKKRTKVQARAERYTEKIVHIYNGTLNPLLVFLGQIDQTAAAKALDVPETISMDVSSAEQFRLQVVEPVRDIIGLVEAVGAGTAATSGATALVTLFGTASTGTAIGGLSGAAATNATLAWLGGGSLAAGGGGMAAGTAMLCGIAVTPALLVGGLVLNGKGEKALTKARKYASEVDVHVENLGKVRTLLRGIIRRVDELDSLLEGLNMRALESLKELDARTFDSDSDTDIANLQACLLYSSAISQITRTPILNSDGEVTSESERIQIRYRPLLESQEECA